MITVHNTTDLTSTVIAEATILEAILPTHLDQIHEDILHFVRQEAAAGISSSRVLGENPSDNDVLAYVRENLAHRFTMGDAIEVETGVNFQSIEDFHEQSGISARDDGS